jgi:hypothetical protein
MELQLRKVVELELSRRRLWFLPVYSVMALDRIQETIGEKRRLVDQQI